MGVSTNANSPKLKFMKIHFFAVEPTQFYEKRCLSIKSSDFEIILFEEKKIVLGYEPCLHNKCVRVYGSPAGIVRKVDPHRAAGFLLDHVRREIFERRTFGF
jgi:hypothetical protein